MREEDVRTARRCLRRALAEKGQPYFPWLVLGALVSLAAIGTASSEVRVQSVARGLRLVFTAFHLRDLSSFDPQSNFAATVSGDVPGISPARGETLIYSYMAMWRDVTDWMTTLPVADQSHVRKIMVPPISDLHRLWRHAAPLPCRRPLRGVLDERRDRLMAVYASIPDVARQRLCFLESMASTAEGSCVIDACGARHHVEASRIPSPDDPVTVVEYVKAEDGVEPWFLPLLRRHILGRAGRSVAAAAWLQERGLTKTHFWSRIPGLLAPTSQQHQAVYDAQQHAQGLCFALEPLLLPARFAQLMLGILYDTGARAAEMMQLAADPDRIRQDLSGAWWFKARAKGGLAHEYPMSAETARAAQVVASTLRAHYGLAGNASLPQVPGRYRSAPPGRYLFQYDHRHFDRETAAACLRFLTYGIGSEDGQDLPLHFHLFRHACANAKHEAGVPLATVGNLLHHSTPSVTYHYTRPTRSQVLRAALTAIGRRS